MFTDKLLERKHSTTLIDISTLQKANYRLEVGGASVKHALKMHSIL